ncbi:MAG: hypothetical protein V7746_03590 [Halioglobus sp.]
MSDQQQINRSRMMILLIAGIPITVILISTWLWYYVVQGNLDLVSVLGTSNNGTLVQPPRELEGVDLLEAGSLPFHYSELGRKWTFLVPGGDVCDVQCEKNLYLTRQIHIALGKGFNRIQRIYLSTTTAADTAISFPEQSDNRPAPASFDEFLDTEHRGLKALKIDRDAFTSLAAEFAADPTIWYLVDPAGWIMMSYNGEVDYKGVISDMKFLLKNSSE